MTSEALKKVRNLIVLKRDGKKEEFNLDKMINSLRKAYSYVEGLPEDVLDNIIESVLKDLSLREGEISSTVISDLIEKHIVSQIVDEPLWEEVAKRFVLARIYNHVYGKGSWKTFDQDDLKLTFNALKVLEARYLLKDPETLRFRETPKLMFDRVARNIALPEKEYGRYDEFKKKFFNMLTSLKFMPNSPTLMNAGTKNGVLSACYVLPVRDAMATARGDGIMDALKAQALIQQQAGGTGFHFSELRPEGDIVKSTTGVASGPLSFMKLFDAVTDVIKQGGKRRGANMGILHIWHPDISKFIKSKSGELKDTVLQNFNISVGVYDKFMEAVEKNEKWPLINPRKTWLHNTNELDSKYYAITQARHSIENEWVQEQIIKELEENDWSIPLHQSKIITWEEALAIAEKENAITKYVNAKELFNEITKGAWDSGDPGIVFIDEMNRRHPTWYLGKINATNPCVTGDTRILTSEGLVRIEDLYEAKRKETLPEAIAEEKAITEKGSREAYPTIIIVPGEKILLYKTVHGKTLEVNKPISIKGLVWKVGLKPIVKIVTKEGLELKTTPDHKVLTSNGWKKAEELVEGDKLAVARIDIDKDPNYGKKIYNNIKLDPELGFILGWLIGDGGLRKYGKETRIDFFFSLKEAHIADYIEEQLRRLFGEDFAITRISKSNEIWMSIKKHRVWDVFNKLGVEPHSKDKTRRVPEAVFQGHSLFVKSFLRGLFTADGTIDNDGAIRLTSKHKELLIDVQQLLLLYGIKSRIYHRPYTRKFRYKTKTGIEKEYETQSYSELIISGFSRKIFAEKIGFFGEKQSRLLGKLNKTKIDEPYFTVEKTVYLGKKLVYDMTVPIVHSYITQWIVSHNCGEQPLLEWESCNLGSVDVSKFVMEKDGEKFVDWNGIAETVKLSIRFLDNVIDMNDHPLPQINEANRRTRKVGLGVMGFAHFLAKLGIPYDSPEAVVLSYRLAEWIAFNAVLASIELAQEKGVFPAFDKELYRPLWRMAPSLEELAETANVKLREPKLELPRVNWDVIEELYEKYGLRNAAVLSIAPTGTISIIAGASSSIEPIFALAFLRLVSVGSFIEIDRVFLKDLEKAGQREPWIIRKIAENGSVQELDFVDERLKKVYKIAHDIDPIWHVLHQAAWQAWVDSGVSKTINLRNEEPQETVDYVYKLAWKLHCKGITVYRDKSKSIQVLNKGIKTEQKEKTKTKTTDEIIENGKKETRLSTKKLRIGKKEIVAVHEEYAGGCPTCDV